MSAFDVHTIICKYNKIIAWGAGKYFEDYHDLLEGQIAYVVDRNMDWHGKEKAGIAIKPLSKLEQEHNKENCLIVVFNAQFEEIFSEAQKIGGFDIIDIKTIEALNNRVSASERDDQSKERELPFVLICAGIHALWGINGSRKFIDAQNEVLYKNGFSILAVAPLQYYQKCNPDMSFVSVSINTKELGIFSIAEFLNKDIEVNNVIIHSLYYNHQILERLLQNITVQGNILYYLHDYYCICNKRFLYYREKTCLSQDNEFNCFMCENREKQSEIQNFHQYLFEKYDIKLVAPSQCVGMLVKKIYRNSNPIIIPHLSYYEEEYPKVLKRAKRIAYIGETYAIKGWNEYKYIFGQLKEKYEFFCLGKCMPNEYVEGITYIGVTIEKSGNSLDMVDALKKYDIDMVFLGAVCPETFSYTYYEAYEAGCFVITNELSGNICSQVRTNQNGIILKSAEDVINWLSDIEKVSEAVSKMNRKIVDVRANERFLSYLLNNSCCCPI